jgi:hypothetical protein
MKVEGRERLLPIGCIRKFHGGGETGVGLDGFVLTDPGRTGHSTQTEI